MIRLESIVAMARTEFRLTFRLVRYWLFASISVVLALLGFAGHSALHYFASGYGSSFAIIAPRFFCTSYGVTFIFLYLIGVVFLAFDVRSRDVRERMVEVIDAQPISNFELLCGRWVGLAAASVLPLVLLAGIMAGVGLIVGESPEPGALVYLIVAQAIPSLLFAVALVYLVVLLVRHRLVAALVLLALWGLMLATFMGALGTSVTSYPLFDIMGANSFQHAATSTFPSDITATLPSLWGLLQRVCLVLASVGLIAIAAACHPRRDDAKPALLVAGGLVGCALFVGVTLVGWSGIRGALGDYDRYAARHESHKTDLAPDVVRLSGDVRIEPGDRIELALELEISAVEGAALDRALFALNPGYAVDAIRFGTADLAYTFEDGLLEVALPEPLGPGERTTLTLEASGALDPDFAYLEGGGNPLRGEMNDGFLFLLGFEPLFFERGYVALLDAVRWLPASGAEIGRHDPSVRPSDPYEIDLRVSLPEGWLAAGPGRRRDEGAPQEGRVLFRFAPQGRVTRVALIADDDFVSRSMEIEGVLLEMLLHRKHAGQFEAFEGIGPALEARLSEILIDARELGLAYPYDGFTLTEVPNALRSFGDGWRRDTTYAQSALALVRESGLPTARFDNIFDDEEELAEEEGGIAQAKLRRLERFVESEVLGGNPLLNASRSFFSMGTAAEGPEGLPLEFVFEDLVGRLLVDQSGYFSARLFKGPRANQTITVVMTGFGLSGGEDLVGAMKLAMAQRVEVWDTLLETPLSEIDPDADPQTTLDVLTLKGGAMAKSLLDAQGRDQAAAILAALQASSVGGRYGRSDVRAAAAESGEDLGEWLSLWLDETELPAFAIEENRVYRLPDGEDGVPRYQGLLRLRNDASVAGLVKMNAYFGDGSPMEATEPLRIEGRSEVELGGVYSKPPTTLYLESYLSQNRRGFGGSPDADDDEAVRDVPALVGIRDVGYSVPQTRSIVVDDLDEGLSVAEPEPGAWLRFTGRQNEDVELDRGIPANRPGPPPNRWERVQVWGAYGRYRHTVAVVSPKRPEAQTATFSAELPEGGKWLLEYHKPRGLNNRIIGIGATPQKIYDVVVDTGQTPQELEFDVGVAVPGWNAVEEFELPGGPVHVTFGAGRGSRLLVADAVRWTPLDTSPPKEGK